MKKLFLPSVLAMAPAAAQAHLHLKDEKPARLLAGAARRCYLARCFGAVPRALLTTLLPVPIVPTGAACSIAVWM